MDHIQIANYVNVHLVQLHATHKLAFATTVESAPKEIIANDASQASWNRIVQDVSQDSMGLMIRHFRAVDVSGSWLYETL